MNQLPRIKIDYGFRVENRHCVVHSSQDFPHVVVARQWKHHPDKASVLGFPGVFPAIRRDGRAGGTTSGANESGLAGD